MEPAARVGDSSTAAAQGRRAVLGASGVDFGLRGGEIRSAETAVRAAATTRGRRRRGGFRGIGGGHRDRVGGSRQGGGG